MANQEQLDIFKQGVEVWNQWRVENPGIDINLREANLFGDNPMGIVLNEVTLIGTDLSHVDFSGADLSGADLSHIDFSYANFSGASLSGADLWYTSLNNANLSYVDLTIAKFLRTILSGANLSNARLNDTIFGIVDLSTVKGLATVMHEGPSTIGIDTIITSQGNIPEIFLRRAGVPPSIIEAIPSLVGSLKPIDFYSCFISYSSKDQDFAERLYADLQSKGVRCWFALEDMKIGDKIRPRIEESIRQFDKLLIVLSEHSIASNWVAYEVERALNKEPQGIPNVLFPIRVDDAVMKSKAGWADDIKSTRHIGDFTHWKNHDDYQKAFSRLLRDLKAET